MLTKRNLVNKLKKETKELENQIKYRKLYNIRNYGIQLLIKSGIALNHSLPFIVAAIIIGHSKLMEEGNPFKIELVSQKANLETIDTSSGKHIKNISYDFDYDDKILEYSTGWIINEKGLYQRTITSYRLDKEFNLYDTEKILSMTKEEIEKSLIITNINTIQKNTLSSYDYIYDEDALIFTNHTLSDENTIERYENLSENALQVIYFIILTFAGGTALRLLEKKLIKKNMGDKLKEYIPLYRQISKEELEEMKKMLEIKKQNLSLITSTENEDNKSYQYKLRRG